MLDTWFERGHVAIVTGGSRGLGKALARELLARGLHVVIDGRDGAALDEARRELAAYGDVTAIAGDVSNKAHAHALIEAARRLGRLDLLVNNASTLGETPLPRIDALTYETFQRVFDVNVYAPIHLMQHAIGLMARSGDVTTIVNVSSDAGVEAYPTWGGYGASKAALEHVSRVFAEENADTRIRVLVADPGDMNTAMHRAAVPDADPASLADPERVALALLHAIAGMRGNYERVALAGVTA